MSRRFTEILKWQDLWFQNLGMEAKLFFLYLCENCDIAGFWEINIKRASFDTSIPESTLKDLITIPSSTHSYPISKSWIADEKTLWLKNFIFHQGNLPLQKNNNVQKAIVAKILSHNSLSKQVIEYLQKQCSEKSLGSLPDELKTYLSHNYPITIPSPTHKDGLTNPSSKSKSKSKSNGKGISKGNSFFGKYENLLQNMTDQQKTFVDTVKRMKASGYDRKEAEKDLKDRAYIPINQLNFILWCVYDKRI